MIPNPLPAKIVIFDRGGASQHETVRRLNTFLRVNPFATGVGVGNCPTYRINHRTLFYIANYMSVPTRKRKTPNVRQKMNIAARSTPAQTGTTGPVITIRKRYRSLDTLGEWVEIPNGQPTGRTCFPIDEISFTLRSDRGGSGFLKAPAGVARQTGPRACLERGQ